MQGYNSCVKDGKVWLLPSRGSWLSDNKIEKWKRDKKKNYNMRDRWWAPRKKNAIYKDDKEEWCFQPGGSKGQEMQYLCWPSGAWTTWQAFWGRKGIGSTGNDLSEPLWVEKYSVHMGKEEAGSEFSLWILKGQGKKDAVAEGQWCRTQEFTAMLDFVRYGSKIHCT